MTFRDLYAQTISLWPVSLNFSDGVIVAEKPFVGKNNSMLRRSGGDSFFSASLSNEFKRIQQITENKDTLIEVMLWTQYQLIIHTSFQLFKNGQFELNPKDLDQTILEQNFFDQLKEGFYEKELEIYQRNIDLI